MHKADNLPPSCAIVTKSGSLNFLEPSGPVQACNGTALPLPYHGCLGLRDDPRFVTLEASCLFVTLEASCLFVTLEASCLFQDQGVFRSEKW